MLSRPLLHALSLCFTSAAALAATTSGPLLLDATQAGEALFAVGERGLVLRSPAAQQDWQPVAAGVVESTLCGVTFADNNVGWAAGHGGVILGTTDGGRTWKVSHQAADPETSFLDVLALSPRAAVAIGAFGLYAETKDGGATWSTRRVTEDDFHLNRISRTPDDLLFIAGEAGTLLRSRDNGESWQALDSGNEGSFFGVLPLRDGSLLAYGLRGRVYVSDDDGDTWEERETGTDGVLLTAAELGDGTIVLAGQARVCLVSRDGARTFQAAEHGVAALAELLVVGERELLGFGEAGIALIDVP